VELYLHSPYFFVAWCLINPFRRQTHNRNDVDIKEKEAVNDEQAEKEEKKESYETKRI
jgi:amino acid permease